MPKPQISKPQRRNKSLILKIFSIRYLKEIFLKVFLPAFLKKKLNFYTKFIAVNEFCKENQAKLIHKKESKFWVNELNLSETEYKDFIEFNKYKLPNEIWQNYAYYQIDNVEILGSSGVMLKEEKVVLSENRDFLHRNYIKAKKLEELYGDDNKIYVKFLGIKKGHKHFYHFFADYLSQLLLFLDYSSNRDRKFVIIVRDDLSEIQEKTYEYIEKTHDNIEFLRLKYNQKIFCKKSMFLSYESNFFRYFLDIKMLERIKEFYFSIYNIKEKNLSIPEKIYISRKDAKIRKIINEQQLINALRRKNFEIFVTGKLPFKKQIEIFFNAKTILSIHGAAQANMIFSPINDDKEGGQTIIEIFPETFRDIGFLLIGKTKKLDYKYFFGSKEDLKRNFSVDINALLQFIT